MAGNDVRREILNHFSRELDGYLDMRRTVGWRSTALDNEYRDRLIKRLTRWIKWLKGESNDE